MKITRIVLMVILFVVLTTTIYSISVTSTNEPTMVPVQGKIRTLDPEQILVSFLPLSIGESTIIQLPNNDFYLIDTGSEESSNNLINLLLQHGIRRVKGVILTNPFDEHIGGLANLMDKMPVETIYIPKLISNTFKIPKNGQTPTTVKTLKVNDQLHLDENCVIKVLAPSEPLSLSPQANSLVFQLMHKDVKFLFTSDINREVEERLVNQYNLDSEILKVSDFGANSGSAPEFLEEVDAQVGVIFSSNPELYKLSDDVIERLHETWIDVYIIKRYGEIQIISYGDNYDVEVIKKKN